MPEPVEGVMLRVADAVGALMEAWGFKRNMGRLWALLYLEQRPLSAQDISDRLAISSGATSMLLTELQQWSIVKKTWIPGERREHFEAETSIWKMVSRVFRERELRWIEDALTAFEGAQAELAKDPAAAGDAARDHLDSRIAALTELSRVGAHLLRAILDGATVDALPIKTVGELAQAVQGPGKKPPG
jgi:HTH-type transcriptional regulator, glycine betaine synthesis regulator